MSKRLAELFSRVPKNEAVEVRRWGRSVVRESQGADGKKRSENLTCNCWIGHRYGHGATLEEALEDALRRYEAFKRERATGLAA